MTDRKANRREFIETVGAVGATSALFAHGKASANTSAASSQQLAIDGGTPVRSSMLGSGPYGTMFYDEVEEQNSYQ